MAEVDRVMQERNLKALAKSPGGFQFTNTFFPYTSGEIGPYYVQSAAIMANGEAYSNACVDMTKMIREALTDFSGVISGGESRDWCFSGPVAAGLSLPHVMIYKDKKFIGADMKDKNVIHVADLNNEGSSPRDLWVPTIKAAGGKIEHIFFYVDRMEDGVEEMKKLGLQSHAIIPLDEHAWEYLQKIDVVSKEVYKSLSQRMINKDAWAENMLRSDAGLETLVALLASSKNREKAQKILDKGYPHLKDELIEKIGIHHGPGVTRWVA